MLTARIAITEAEPILAGPPGPATGQDPRWQAIIRVAEFVESEPDELWHFAQRWGASPDPDLRAAIATCLLEHLLEHHFTYLFQRVAAAARADPRFADTFLQCWRFGQTLEPQNAAQLDGLVRDLGGPSITRSGEQ
jgi:hypothetical protein